MSPHLLTAFREFLYAGLAWTEHDPCDDIPRRCQLACQSAGIESMIQAEELLQKLEDQQNRMEYLEAITVNDMKEIGSYTKGTGLRGENRKLRNQLDRYLEAMQGVPIASRDMSTDDVLAFLNDYCDWLEKYQSENGR